MSEQVPNPQVDPAVLAQQQAHLHPGIDPAQASAPYGLDAPEGQIDNLDGIFDHQNPEQVENEQPVATETAIPEENWGETTYSGVAEATSQKKDRLLVRIGKALQKTESRRLPSEFAKDAASTTTEKLGLGARFARKLGKLAIKGTKRAGAEIKRTAADIRDNAKDDFGPTAAALKNRVEDAKGLGVASKELVKSKWATRAEKAQARKDARAEKRAEKAAEKQAYKEEFKARIKADKEYNKMRDEAWAENKAFDKAAKEEQRAESKMLKEAYADNKKFDRNKRTQERNEIIARRARAAGVAGKAVLKGAGIGIVAGPAVVVGGAAYGVYKAGQKGAELTGRAASATAAYTSEKYQAGRDRVDESVQTRQANRATKHLDKAGQKAEKYQLKSEEAAAKHTGKAATAAQKAVDARDRREARQTA